MKPTATTEPTRRDALAALAALATLGSLPWSGAARAQSAGTSAFPTQPIRIVVGFAPGGGADSVARLMGPFLSEALGVPVIIENKPGAGGNLATEAVARAKPDGHTVLMGTIASLAINPAIYDRLSFNPDKDLAAVSNAVDSCNVLVVTTESPIQTLPQLLQAAKARSLNYGSSGIGTAGHLAAVQFARVTGTNSTHVPYRSGGHLMNAILSREVDFSFASGVTAMPQLQGGKLRALAVTTAQRSAALPQVPTLHELGLRGFANNNWHGFVAPAGTPKPVIERLNREIVKVLGRPDLREKLLAQALDPAPTTPEAFAAFMRAERQKWARIVKEAGVKPND
jgi:tripartite-type tricarboxylate transporter receptor subunit TctC